MAPVKDDCFPVIDCPLQYDNIRQEQQQEPLMLQQLQDLPQWFQYRTFNQVDLICRRVGNDWKICLPTALGRATLQWYHHMPGHVGETRLYQTLSAHLYHPELRQRVESFVAACQVCKNMKLPGKGYGHLPPREARLQPFEEVAVDTVGPWPVDLPHGQKMYFSALTTICTVSNLVELVRKRNGTSVEAGRCFESSWLF